MSLTVKLAETDEERHRVYALRHQVFIQEQAHLLEGNVLKKPVSEQEEDEYDAISEHLIVVDENSGDVIGTYRFVEGHVAIRTIGFYSERFFYLQPIEPLLPEAVELGRSCIRADYRNGRAITLLWRAIGELMLKRQIRYLIGMPSLYPASVDELRRIYTFLNYYHRMEEFWLQPRSPYRIEGLREVELADSRQEFRCLPPLLKGYLRAGACVAGGPAYDPVFGSTLFFTILDRMRIDERYRRSFLDRPISDREESTACTIGSDE
ncbi:MAG: GNAT family N-acetyltransferase [Brevibacillus sp.]|nr:GNAT family N-acetyltransferase [Brevibacillus sp.]